MDIFLILGLFIGSLALLFGVIYLIIVIQAKRVGRNGTQLAQELGLEFKRKPRRLLSKYGEPYVEGVIQNRAMQITTYSVSTGQSSQTWCQVAVEMPANRGLIFSILKRRLFTGVAQMFKADGVKTGDANFDKHFLLKCNDSMFVQSAFFPETCAQIAERWTRCGLKGEMKLGSKTLWYQEPGSFAGKKACAHIAEAARLLVEAALWVDAYNETRGADARKPLV